MSIGRIVAVVVLVLALLVGLTGVPIPLWVLVAAIAAGVAVG